MIKAIKFLSVGMTISALSLLTGCAGMNTQFDCKATSGVSGCATLDQVNRMADQGAFANGDTALQNTQVYSQKISPNALNAAPEGSWQNTALFGKPLRMSETVQNVWIAPYETKDGSYSWPSMVSIVLRPGHWVGAPSKEIQKSGEL